jgi:hypothetical protein
MVRDESGWYPTELNYTTNQTNSLRSVELTYAAVEGLTFSEAKDTEVAIQHHWPISICGSATVLVNF